MDPLMAVEFAEKALSVAIERCVVAHDFGGCRGLRVEKDVEQGELLLRVPLAATFSAARARKDLGTLVEKMDEQDALISLLLSERSKGSSGTSASYIANLPSVTELDSPLFWAADDLDYLHGQAKVRSELLTSAVDSAYENFLNVRPPDAPEVTLGDYRWARGILNSRQLDVSGVDGCVLVPGVDLINHDSQILDVRCVFLEEDSICVRASRSYRANEEVFISYGNCGNAQLLVGHGFATLPNPSDVIELFLDVGSLDAGRQQVALEVARSCDWKIEDLDVQCKISTLEPLPAGLLEFVKACAGGCSRRGLAMLLIQLSQMLTQYPVSIGEDTAALAKNTLPWRRYCAVVCRLGEQQLILKAIQLVTEKMIELIPVGQLSQNGLEQQQASVVNQYSQFAELPPRQELQSQWIVFATAAFLALYGRLRHKCAKTLLGAALATPVVTSFAERMSFWGSYLAAQFCVTGSISRNDATAMLMESTDLRNNLGWSIPTLEAVKMISSLPQPIELVGAAESVSPWRDALSGAGVQLVSEDGMTASTRIVIWPDPGGEGTAGLDLVNEAPSVLVCIGEWEGCTLELLSSPEGRKGGQAWSLDAQNAVQSRFSCTSVSYLPSWPLACDRLAVYHALDSQEQ